MTRKDWDSYFCDITTAVANRATCPRLKVGCTLVKDKRIIATGYNGSPSGAPHCTEVGCEMRDRSCVRTIHAEQNAINQCAKYGVDTNGCTAYVTHQPCLNCTKTLIQAGVKRIVYIHPYRKDEFAEELLEGAGVEVHHKGHYTDCSKGGCHGH